MTHRCCKCGSDNCCCPATPEEVKKEDERLFKQFLECLSTEEMEAEIKKRKKAHVKAEIARLQKEMDLL